jgi:hypothetical protein
MGDTMKMRSIVACASAAVLAMASVIAGQQIPVCTHQGSWGGLTENMCTASYAGHSYCFMGMGANFKVVRVDSAVNPVEIGSLYIGDMASAIAVRDTVAYVVTRSKGLFTVSIKDPGNPVPLGQCPLQMILASSIVLKDNHAFVAGGYYGILSVDITNPAFPYLVQSKQIAYEVDGIDSSGGNLYAACADSGLRILSIANPSNPVVLGAFKTYGRARALKVSNGSAFVAEEDSGIEIVNVSNPGSCSSVGKCHTVSNAWDIALKGTWALIADYLSSFQIIDVSDLSKPVLAQGYSFPPYCYAEIVSILGNNAYVTGGYNALQIFDISNLPSLQWRGDYDAMDMPEDMEVSGNYAFVADNVFGVHILNVSNPKQMVRCGPAKLTNHGRKVHLSGNYLYVASQMDGLDIFAVTNPIAPQKLSNVPLPGIAEDVAISNNYAYVANNGYGLTVLDISNPAGPVQQGTCTGLGAAIRVAVNGKSAFVAAYDSGFQIIDISNPVAPNKRYAYPARVPNGLAVHGDYAYMLDIDSGMQVFSVKDPLQAKRVSRTPCRGMDVDFLDSFALVADWGSGLVVFKIADPSKPVRCASYALPGITEGLFVSNGSIYVADGESGLHIYSVKNNSGVLFIGPPRTTEPGPVASARGNILSLESLKPFTSVDVSLIAVSGKRIAHGKSLAVGRSGSVNFPIGKLSPGIFCVSIETHGIKITRRIAVN